MRRRTRRRLRKLRRVVGYVTVAAVLVYFGGVYMTSQKVSLTVESQTKQLTEYLAPFGAFSVTGQSGLFSSGYEFSLLVDKLPDPFNSWLRSGEVVTLALKVSHGFFSAHSRVELLPGVLRERLALYQDSPQQVPFEIAATHRLSPFDTRLIEALRIKTDAFTLSTDVARGHLGEIGISYYHRGSRLQSMFKVDELTLVGKQGELSLQDIHGNQSGLLNHEGRFDELEGLIRVETAILDQAMTKTEVSGAEIDLFQKREAQTLRSDIDLLFTSAVVSTPGALSRKFDLFHADLAVDTPHLDAERLVSLLGSFTDGGQSAQLEQWLASGAEMTLKETIVSVGGSRIEASGHGRVGAGEGRLGPRTQAQGSLRMEPPLAPWLQEVAGIDMGQLALDGWMSEKGSNYISRIAFSEETITVNGKHFDLSAENPLEESESGVANSD